MNVHGKPTRTIWLHPQNPALVQIIDQRSLPHAWVVEDLSTVGQVATAIRDMHVRGAGLIGATAGFGMYLATLEAKSAGGGPDSLQQAGDQLKATRPTAVNLAWAVDRQSAAIAVATSPEEMVAIALRWRSRKKMPKRAGVSANTVWRSSSRSADPKAAGRFKS